MARHRHRWQTGVDCGAATAHEICRCGLMRRPDGSRWLFRKLGFAFPWQRLARMPTCPAIWLDFPQVPIA